MRFRRRQETEGGAQPSSAELLAEHLTLYESSLADRDEAQSVRDHDRQAGERQLGDLVEALALGKIDRQEYERAKAEIDGTNAANDATLELEEQKLAVLRAKMLDLSERDAEEKVADVEAARADVNTEREEALAVLARADQQLAALDERENTIHAAARAFRADYDPELRKLVETERRQALEFARWLVMNKPGTARRLAQTDPVIAEAVKFREEEVARENAALTDQSEQSFAAFGMPHPQPDVLAKLRGNEPPPRRPGEVRPGEAFPVVRP